MIADDESDEPRFSIQRTTTTTTTTISGSKRRCVNRHKRFSSTSDSFSSLPEYQRVPAVTLKPEKWKGIEGDDEAEDEPPGYPGNSHSQEQEEERDMVRDSLVVLPRRAASTSGKRRLVSHRRSFSGPSRDRLDELLERSVRALETSNALLASSISTHSSLAAVLADNSFDRTVDAQIRFLTGSVGPVADARESGMEEVLKGVSGLIMDDEDDNFSISRSLPAHDHLQRHRTSSPRVTKNSGNRRRLRLSADGERPRSPPPRALTQYVSIESENGFASESTSTQDTIYLPSTMGLRSASHISEFSPSPLPSPTIYSSPTISSACKSTPDLRSTTPQSSTAAYHMLSSIATRSRDLSPVHSAARGALQTSPRIQNFRRHPSDNRWSSRGADPELDQNHPSLVPSSLPSSSTMIMPPPPSSEASSPTSSIWTCRRPQSVNSHARLSELDLRTPIGSPRLPPPLADDHRFALEQDAPADSADKENMKTVETLRKILAKQSSQIQLPLSEVANGKQRAHGERPSVTTSPSRSPASSLNFRHPALMVISPPSLSGPIVYRGEKTWDLSPVPYVSDETGSSTTSTTTNTASPRWRKSALKSSSTGFGSGRTSPVSSSGRSTPRVSFSPLPPKHQSDGSLKARRSKSAKKRRLKKGSDDEDTGVWKWWSDWLLGEPAKVGGGIRRSPSFAGSSLTREEAGMGRVWGGGLDSWQV
ncbi:hypothetical protein FRC03_001886 [Tulasnella sp. 419]|nr:hypothetical protein FRC03_001886 [Tulasnella sp. 419]